MGSLLTGTYYSLASALNCWGDCYTVQILMYQCDSCNCGWSNGIGLWNTDYYCATISGGDTPIRSYYLQCAYVCD
jgi:hypothetical protein